VGISKGDYKDGGDREEAAKRRKRWDARTEEKEDRKELKRQQ